MWKVLDMEDKDQLAFQGIKHINVAAQESLGPCGSQGYQKVLFPFAQQMSYTSNQLKCTEFPYFTLW